VGTTTSTAIQRGHNELFLAAPRTPSVRPCSCGLLELRLATPLHGDNPSSSLVVGTNKSRVPDNWCGHVGDKKRRPLLFGASPLPRYHLSSYPNRSLFIYFLLRSRWGSHCIWAEVSLGPDPFLQFRQARSASAAGFLGYGSLFLRTMRYSLRRALSLDSVNGGTHAPKVGGSRRSLFAIEITRTRMAVTGPGLLWPAKLSIP